MLLVWRQVQHDICGRNQFFIGAHRKPIFSRILPGLAFLLDRLCTQCVGHIQATVTQVQTLIQALRDEGVNQETLEGIVYRNAQEALGAAMDAAQG